MAARRPKELEDDDDDVPSPQHGDDDLLMTRSTPQLGDTHGLSPVDVRDSAPQDILARMSFGDSSPSRCRGRGLLPWTSPFGTPSPSRGRGRGLLPWTSPFGSPSPSRDRDRVRGLLNREPSPLCTSSPVTPFSTIGDQRNPSGGARRTKDDGGGAQGRKLHFSKMKEGQLEAIYHANFHKIYFPTVDHAPTTSSISLRNYITEGASKDVWRELCTTYTSFFNDAESSTEPSVPVPLLLRPLFRHLRTTRKEHINLLSNGAGKSFVAAMFSILDIEMNVRTSTTNDPRRDWCGVDVENVSRVVDVAVVSGGVWWLIGEIKGGEEKGEVQLLAAMSARRSMQGSWPFGLTVNHEYITVIEVKEKGGETTLLLLHYLYVTRSLEHLVRFMDHMERVLRGPEKLMRGLSIGSRGSGIGKAEDLERITRNIQMRAEERILEMEERLDKKFEKRLENSLEQRLENSLEQRLENSLEQRFKEVENSLEQRLQEVENSLVQRFEEVESSLASRRG